MKVQIIEDAQGNPTGVFIPIEDWEKLKKKYKIRQEVRYPDPDRDQLVLELKEAVVELQKIEQGKLKGRSAKSLLDEL